MYNVGNVFGIKISGSMDFDERIKKGFPFSMARKVQRRLDIPDKDLARILGVSMSTFRRLKKRKGKLSFVSSDRLYRAAALFAWAADVLESEEDAREWLTRPHGLFGHKPPIEVAETEPGSREVENMLGRIRYGIPV
ncbi:MAG: DUF2384 domain-containing protein [Nitrospiraceae bacterium]|nr:DUF2384 domain-containing protein [Nitrospiraceae bacterium]